MNRRIASLSLFASAVLIVLMSPLTDFGLVQFDEDVARPKATGHPGPVVADAPQDADLEGTLSVEEEDGLYFYKVSGTVALPDGAFLGVSMHYVSTDRDGKEEVNTLWHKRSDVKGSARVRDGAFEVTLGGYAREPYPIHYRARVSYDPDNQTDAIARRYARALSRPFDLKAAPAEVLEKRLTRMRREIVRDFNAVEALYHELKKQFTAIQKGGLSPASWDTWKNDFLDRLDELKAVNGQRFETWIIWTERSAKLKLEGLTSMLTYLVADGSHILDTAPSRRQPLLEKALGAMRRFLKDYHDDRDALGLEKGPSPKALQSFKRVRKSIEDLLTYADRVLATEKPPDSFAGTIEKHRRALVGGWLDIAHGMPKRGQEPVHATARAAGAWVDEALAFSASKRDAAAKKKLAAARRTLEKALQNLGKAIGAKPE